MVGLSATGCSRLRVEKKNGKDLIEKVFIVIVEMVIYWTILNDTPLVTDIQTVPALGGSLEWWLPVDQH